MFHVGLRYNLPTPLLAALMAFGAGTMVAAVSPNYSSQRSGPNASGEPAWPVLKCPGLWVADRLIEIKLGAGALEWALMLGALLDGIPETPHWAHTPLLSGSVATNT